MSNPQIFFITFLSVIFLFSFFSAQRNRKQPFFSLNPQQVLLLTMFICLCIASYKIVKSPLFSRFAGSRTPIVQIQQHTEERSDRNKRQFTIDQSVQNLHQQQLFLPLPSFLEKAKQEIENLRQIKDQLHITQRKLQPQTTTPPSPADRDHKKKIANTPPSGEHFTNPAVSRSEYETNTTGKLSSEGNFSNQIASFSDLENALKFIKSNQRKLTGMNYALAIAGQNSPYLFKILVGGFEGEASARAHLPKLKRLFPKSFPVDTRNWKIFDHPVLTQNNMPVS